MAILARVPESIWSMRCPSGCPTVKAIPGIPDSLLRTSAKNSSRGRPLRVKLTSTSALLTVCECSSSSPRPVRRHVLPTSGIDNISFSTRLPSLLDSPREVPGCVTTESVKAPSLNSGKKLRPKLRKTSRATTKNPTTGNTTHFLCCKAHISDFS